MILALIRATDRGEKRKREGKERKKRGRRQCKKRRERKEE